MPASMLLTWWNLVFLVPLLMALAYVGVYAFSGMTFGDDLSVETDHDADFHVDSEADVHADADADAHVETDADGDAEAESHGHDGHADGGNAPFYVAVLSFFGVGKVPLSIILMVLFMSWGTIGLLTNAILRNAVSVDWMVSAFSLPLAAVGSVGITKGLSGLLKKWLPSNETYVERKAELIGMTGEAMFNIDEKFGRVSVRSRHGDLFQVPCRVFDDAEPIAKGEKVLVVEHDAKEDVYFVTRYELDQPSNRSSEVPFVRKTKPEPAPRIDSIAGRDSAEAVQQ